MVLLLTHLTRFYGEIQQYFYSSQLLFGGRHFIAYQLPQNSDRDRGLL